jgi:hypothetical protein
MFLRTDRTDIATYGVARAPGERADATSLLRPAPTGPPAYGQPAPAGPPTAVGWAGPPQAGGELTCPRCGHRSPPTRIRCERCGMELRPAMQMPVETAPLKEPSTPGRSRTGLVVALVLAGIAVLVVGTYFLVHRAAEDGPPAGPTGAAPPSAAPLVRVDSAAVRVRASSTNPNETRYRAASMLDGDRTTAWNSGGDKLDSNVGVRLTFTFDRPVRLARINLINGYVRTKVLFDGNERVARFTVGTGSGEVAWDLKDSDQPQSLDLDGQPTDTVTLTVDGVYPGNKYKDVCVTEIVFFERT